MVRAKEALDTLAEARAFKPHDRRMVQSMIDRNFQHIRMAATGRSGDSGPPPPPPGPPLPPPSEEPIWPARRHHHSGASSSGTPMPAAKGAPPAQCAAPYARLKQAPKAPALVSASASSPAAGWARGSIGDEVRAQEAAARHARRVKLDQAEAEAQRRQDSRQRRRHVKDDSSDSWAPESAPPSSCDSSRSRSRGRHRRRRPQRRRSRSRRGSSNSRSHFRPVHRGTRRSEERAAACAPQANRRRRRYRRRVRHDDLDMPGRSGDLVMPGDSGPEPPSGPVQPSEPPPMRLIQQARIAHAINLDPSSSPEPVRVSIPPLRSPEKRPPPPPSRHDSSRPQQRRSRTPRSKTAATKATAMLRSRQSVASSAKAVYSPSPPARMVEEIGGPGDTRMDPRSAVNVPAEAPGEDVRGRHSKPPPGFCPNCKKWRVNCFLPGDWACDLCGNHNHARRDVCPNKRCPGRLVLTTDDDVVAYEQPLVSGPFLNYGLGWQDRPCVFHLFVSTLSGM
jgi:hypothetical protein